MATRVSHHWRRSNRVWHFFIWEPNYKGKELGDSVAQMSVCGSVSSNSYDQVAYTFFTESDVNVCPRCRVMSSKVRVPVEHE